MKYDFEGQGYPTLFNYIISPVMIKHLSYIVNGILKDNILSWEHPIILERLAEL